MSRRLTSAHVLHHRFICFFWMIHSNQVYNIAMEHPPFLMAFTKKDCGFSIVMLVYQRVLWSSITPDFLE